MTEKIFDGYAGGHTFVDGECACGRRLVDLRGLTASDVGKPDIAHFGNSTYDGIGQINALIAKMDAHFEMILGWARTQKE